MKCTLNIRIVFATNIRIPKNHYSPNPNFKFKFKEFNIFAKDKQSKHEIFEIKPLYMSLYVSKFD